MTGNARGGCQKQGLLVSTRASSTDISKPGDQKPKKQNQQKNKKQTNHKNNKNKNSKFLRTMWDFFFFFFFWFYLTAKGWEGFGTAPDGKEMGRKMGYGWGVPYMYIYICTYRRPMLPQFLGFGVRPCRISILSSSLNPWDGSLIQDDVLFLV